MRKRVADLNRAMVVQTDDVARVSFFDVFAAVGLKGNGIGDLNIFTDPYMIDFHALIEFTGANPHKCHTVAMGGIHIGLNFKHKTGEFFLVRLNFALFRLARPGAGRIFGKCVQ